MIYRYFASCPLYFEDLLEAEVLELGATKTERVPSGVAFEGDEALLYRCCLRLRTASNLRLVLSNFKATNAEELYNEVRKVAWLDHITSASTFACYTTKQGITFAPENFLTLKVKDAIADTFAKIGRRPNVAKDDPDLLVALHIKGSSCSLALELGRSLFKRGYRVAFKTEQNERIKEGLLSKKVAHKEHQAPLKENLAAALLIRADWPKMASEGKPLVDFMCGSGTFLLEAYSLATHRAVNLERQNFGFEKWLKFNPELFQQEQEEAKTLFKPELAPKIYGYDILESAVLQSQSAVKAMGASFQIQVEQGDATLLSTPCEGIGLIVSNPPYGERLLDPEKAALLYGALGINLKKNFKGWEAALLVPYEGILKYLDVRARRVNSFFNGAEKRYFVRFALSEEERGEIVLTDSATQLKNRLEKRLELLKELAQTEWYTDCYRLYDADLPEYNAACDVYAGYLVVQEYAPPAELPLEVAKNRLKELLHTLHLVTGIAKPHIFLKQRRRQKPTDQYKKQVDELTDSVGCVVAENSLSFKVNLNEYVDTGLYLDHRPLRRLIKEGSAGKDFLNLFSYTGSLSVAAAAGGAKVVCSVDSSNTYLLVAKENMSLNGYTADHYTFIKSDVKRYLTEGRHLWDIIYCDPPTFSNSKMRDSFDIDKDHSDLIKTCMQRLNAGGVLYFSTHYRRFKLDEALFSQYKIKDLTLSSLDADFKRYPIHKLWAISSLTE